MSKSTIVIRTEEERPHLFYQDFSQKHGGTWDGSHYKFDNDLGRGNFCAYTYLNGVVIVMADYNVKLPVEIINIPKNEERIVAIRIGFHGNMLGHSSDMGNAEGISIYDANRPYNLTFPGNKTIRWMSIRVPLRLIDDWKTSDIQGDKFFRRLKEEKDWFFYHRLSPEIESLVRSAFMSMEDIRLNKSIFYSRAYEIIARLILLIEDDSSQPVSKTIHPDDFSLMHKIKEQLLSDFSVLPNIGAISEQYNITDSKLQRSFKAVFGMPIIKFYNQHRLEEANRLFKYTTKSILEISEELGFHSASHLSRTFKQQFGYSPNELRAMK
ncbi:helix-turn-helix transcriptional regulator [Aureibacter tunicatorum]|uniref:AraC-like DNA-binding protein n=1 Tax=Aureibacter tunicatorum TaxID=866807 RepID=A0AAE3XRE0_9BACT|nr:helix-turn-helix transcriptional regulator [Aureibacter tunicatorum]MDR6240629.1 AraC-like DNA-binding protein [Aureibacter tunicatorum]BDD06510.1 hypothetical protein AUTU_39930 [Aureibacter tunicatorum]